MSVLIIEDSTSYIGTQSSGSSCAYDPINKKIVVVYQYKWNTEGTANRGYAVVGTVGDTSVSWGTPVMFLDSYYSQYVNVVFDPASGKFVLSGYFNGCVVATVVGESLMFGDAQLFDNIDAPYKKYLRCIAAGGKVIFAYKGTDAIHGSNVGKIIAGTVSGDTVFFGIQKVWYTSAIASTSFDIAYDTVNNKIAIFFREDSAPRTVYTVLCDLLGTTITSNSPSSMGIAGYYMGFTICYNEDTGSFILAYVDAAVVGGWVVVGNVSGTSLSVGAHTLYNGEISTAGYCRSAYNPRDKGVYITFGDYYDSDILKLVGFYQDGLTVSTTDVHKVNDFDTYEPSITYDVDTDKLIVCATGGDGGESVVIEVVPELFWTEFEGQREVIG